MKDDLGYAFLIFRAGDSALLGGVDAEQRAARGHAGGVARLLDRRAICRPRPHDDGGRRGGSVRIRRTQAASARGCLPAAQPRLDRVLRRMRFPAGRAWPGAICRINGVWQDHLLFALLSDDPRPIQGGRA